MAEDTKAPAPAPAAAPVTPNQATASALQSQQGPAGQKDFDPGLKGPLNPNPVAMGAAPTKRFAGGSPLVQNPKPTGPDGELIEDQPAPVNRDDLPTSTLLEMEAGRRAVEQSKMSADERIAAALKTPRNEDGTLRANNAPSNPVDVTAQQAQRKA